jgi:putative ABC transport system permease protein
MTPFATFRLALRALQRNKLRSTLTMLGIVIGVGAVVAMVGIGNGAKAQVEAQIATLGQNVILIFPSSYSTGGVQSGMGGAGTLKLEDAKAIADEVPDVSAVSPGTRVSSQLGFGNQNWSSSVIGEGPEYFEIRQWEITEGSGFTDQDVRSAAKVAVIGATVLKQLFGEEDPLGQIIRVKNVPFQVIGVLKPKGTSVMGTDQDDVVIVPYTTVMKRLSGLTTLRMISVQCANEERSAAVVQAITALLRQRHRARERLHGPQPAGNRGNGDGHLQDHATAFGGDRQRVAGGRGHRHHEYHARERDRTHPGDRHSHRPRRARLRHSHSVSH